MFGAGARGLNRTGMSGALGGPPYRSHATLLPPTIGDARGLLLLLSPTEITCSLPAPQLLSVISFIVCGILTFDIYRLSCLVESCLSLYRKCKSRQRRRWARRPGAIQLMRRETTHRRRTPYQPRTTRRTIQLSRPIQYILLDLVLFIRLHDHMAAAADHRTPVFVIRQFHPPFDFSLFHFFILHLELLQCLGCFERERALWDRCGPAVALDGDEVAAYAHGEEARRASTTS